MRRVSPALVAIALVMSVLVAVPAATVAAETGDGPSLVSEQADENASVAPGAQLAGAVGVQEAELDGEIQSRSFGVRIARANSDDAKAAVVADQYERTESRLTALEQRKESLETARANGSMSESEYRAKVAKLHAETRTTARLANETGTEASTVPAPALERQGVNTTAIRALSERANELSGPEVAAIARGIGGPDVGQPASENAGADRGPGERGTDAGNGPPTDAPGDDTATEPTATEEQATATNETTGAGNTDSAGQTDSPGGN